jgi:cell division protein FtsL
MYKPVMFLTLISLGVFVYIWQQTSAVRLEYKVNDLHREYDRINAENDSLKYRINAVLALEKMDRIAKEKKLFKPDEKSVVYID